jgi:hypothetical protein
MKKLSLLFALFMICAAAQLGFSQNEKELVIYDQSLGLR